MAGRAEIRELLGRIWLFSDLDPAELDEVARLAVSRAADAGETIVQQGDPGGDLFIVLGGHLKVCSTAADGRELVLNLLGPGDVFGEIALLDGKARSATVVALENTELVVVVRAEFLDTVRRHPPIATKLLQTLAGLVRRLSERAEDRAFLGVRERLAKQLLELGNTCGTVLGPNQIVLRVPFSQQDLGDMVEATRESVNKCLRQWTREGIVRRASRRLVIQDRRRLEELTRR